MIHKRMYRTMALGAVLLVLGQVASAQTISKACSICGGSGTQACALCDGKGKWNADVDGKKKKVDCPACKGAETQPCWLCNGVGKDVAILSPQTAANHAEGYSWLWCSSCKHKGVVNCTKCKGLGRVYASGWTQQVVSGTGYKCWTFQVKFKRLDFHSYMGVKYIRNDFVEDTDGKVYDFHHSINTSIIALKTTITEKSGLFNNSQSVDTKTYSDSHLSITLADYKRGDDVENYLNNLSKNPDKTGYFVDGDGNVTRKDEFDL